MQNETFLLVYTKHAQEFLYPDPHIHAKSIDVHASPNAKMDEWW